MNPMVAATNNLRIGLTALQVFTGINAVLGTFSVVYQVSNTSQLSGTGDFLRENSALVSALLGLLIVFLSVAYIFVIGWIKDWQARISEWSQGGSLDKVQLQKLSSTLSRWLIWSQWGPVIAIGSVVLLFTVGGAIVGGVLGGLSSSGSSTLSSIGGAGALGGLLAIGVLLIGSPFVILNWMILKSVKTWMLELTHRVTGQPQKVNLLDQSKTISSWFVFAQVVIVLGVLFSLFSIQSMGSSGSSVESPLSTALNLAGSALNFMLLQWSKTFMFGVAGYVERYGSSSESLSKV